MNAGFIAGWVVLSAFILLATGWRKQLIDDVRPAAAAVCAGGLAVLLLAARRGGTPVAPVGLPPLPMAWTAGWCLAAIALARPRVRGAYLCASAIMTAALWLWMRQMYMSDPVFVLWRPELDAALAAGLAAAILASRFAEQFAVAGLASVVGEWPVYGPAALWEWADRLLLALLMARCVTLGVGALMRLAPLRAVRALGRGGGAEQERGSNET